MASELDIWNLSLALLNTSQTVQSENDNTTAAGSCRRFYPWARKRVLEKGQWDFAVKFVALTLLLDQNTLTVAQTIYPGWRYVYQRPGDCLRALAVTTNFGLRTNPFLAFWWRAGAMDCSAGSWGPFTPPWRQVLDMGLQSGTLVPSQAGNAVNILTDQDSAFLVYVADVTNPALFSQSLMQAIAWNLAVPIAGPLSANEEAKQLAARMAEQSINDSIAIDLSQKQPDPYPDSPAITCRN